MSTVIDNLERAQLRRVPQFAAGDRVRVHFQVIEGTRRRTQVFEGVVIKRQGEGVRETFTVRKQSFGVGVERTFPLHSPKIEKIDVADLRIVEAVAQPVDEHPLADLERRQHRAGRDPIGLDEERLDAERQPERHHDDQDQLEKRAGR